LTNGDDTTVKLWNNANRNYLVMENKGSHSILGRMSEDECKESRSGMDKQMKMFKNYVNHKKNNVFFPDDGIQGNHTRT